ncbi:MAG: DJ-1/PfpI family protein [Mariprofundaceae bacterium]|nr:DJ-1/PfpI family protein [Mariprofundaceae bacterium]
MSKVLIPFAEGVEEIELITVIDVLRRADVEVCAASLDGAPVLGRSKITLQADAALEQVMHDAWDMIVLPGGLPNAFLLRDDANVKAVVNRLREERKLIAAICAAPMALAAYGLTAGKRVTSYPSCQAEMESLQPSSVYVDETVVEDDFLVTSRGPGTAMAFSLHLLGKLCGQKKAEEIRQSMVA